MTTREAHSPSDRQRWIRLIKELRLIHACSIAEAECIALNDPVWIRWVENRIENDPRCAKLAREHIRHRGASALLVVRDGRLVVRERLSE